MHDFGGNVPGSEVVAVFSNVPPLALLWPLLLATGVYFLLRWVVREHGNQVSAATASRHALWVGVLGWLASSLQPAGNAGILPVGSAARPLTGPADIIQALAWPVLGCLAVHAIGQLSYPRPRLPQQPVTLEVRKMRDFLPRRLAWTVLVVFALAAAQISWTAALPGFAPVQWGSRPDGPNGCIPYGGDGRIPGFELAACLGVALIILAMGTLAVLTLISRRRQLESLPSEDNDLLRTIAMNRLLRTVATVAAGLAAIAGNHAARPDPSSVSGSWTNAAGVVGLGILLAMWWWAPPKLPAARAGNGLDPRGAPEAATHPATRLLVSLGAALGLAALVPAALVLMIPGIATGHPALAVAVSASSVLVATAAGELLLQRNHGAPDAPRTWPLQSVSPALLSTAVGAFAVLVVAVVLTATAEAAADVAPAWPGTAWAGAAVCAVSLLPLAAARLRRGIPAVVPGLDAALRAITIHRMVRALAACFTVQAGVLLLFAGPAVRRAVSLEPVPWSWFWEASGAVGALLTATGVVIAVIPVRSFARTPAAGRQAVREPVT
ncbi:hypothetical protein QF038_001045 [Pseudarthrobacter sp. W1I19]|nr:hypothetical protein [Pseudarthrobacter sp. W1I19]